MKIYKFGGTSVGSASRMASVAEIINDGQEKIVVLSAMSGTTNSLVEISDNCYAGDVAAAAQKTESLREKYRSVVDELFSSAQTRERAHAFIEEKFNRLGECINANFTVQDEKKILSFGELISTELFHYYLSQQGIGSALIPALSFMRTDRLGEPDLYYITKNIEEQLSRGDKDIHNPGLYLPERMGRSGQPPTRGQRLHGHDNRRGTKSRRSTDMDRHRRVAQQRSACSRRYGSGSTVIIQRSRGACLFRS